MRMKELEARLTINENNLDKEIMDQAVLYHEAGVLCAEVEAVRNEARVVFAETSAAVAEKIRISPENQGKISEKRIEALLPLEGDYIESNKNLSIADKAYRLAQILVDSFDMKGKMLRALAYRESNEMKTGSSYRSQEANVIRREQLKDTGVDVK